MGKKWNCRWSKSQKVTLALGYFDPPFEASAAKQIAIPLMFLS